MFLVGTKPVGHEAIELEVTTIKPLSVRIGSVGDGNPLAEKQETDGEKVCREEETRIHDVYPEFVLARSPPSLSG